MSTNLEKNMSAINELYPELHKWINEQPDNDWIKRDGENQLYVSSGTTFLPMYPPENPLHSLEQFDLMKWNKENVTVIIGIGIGHALVFSSIQSLRKSSVSLSVSISNP